MDDLDRLDAIISGIPDDIAPTPPEEAHTLTVQLVGGPYDGHRQALMSQADLRRPRDTLGTWMIAPEPWPANVPDGSVARAVYEPDPDPAPADRWIYRGWTYT